MNILSRLFLLILLIGALANAGCDTKTASTKNDLVLHYIDLSNKTMPASMVLDDNASKIMDNSLAAAQAADFPRDQANYLMVCQKADLLKHYVGTCSSHFTVQHLIADAEVNRDTQLEVDSVLKHAREAIAGRIGDELSLIPDYIAATDDAQLQELLRKLQSAMSETKSMVEGSLPTNTYN